MCSYAQEWANKLAKENRFEHRSNSSYGENLYCTWSSNPKSGVSDSIMIMLLPMIKWGKSCFEAFLLLILLAFQCSGDKAVESWYDEIKDHQFGREPNSMGTGTNQILFKDVL